MARALLNSTASNILGKVAVDTRYDSRDGWLSFRARRRVDCVGAYMSCSLNDLKGANGCLTHDNRRMNGVQDVGTKLRVPVDPSELHVHPARWR